VILEEAQLLPAKKALGFRGSVFPGIARSEVLQTPDRVLLKISPEYDHVVSSQFLERLDDSVLQAPNPAMSGELDQVEVLAMGGKEGLRCQVHGMHSEVPFSRVVGTNDGDHVERVFQPSGIAPYNGGVFTGSAGSRRPRIVPMARNSVGFAAAQTSGASRDQSQGFRTSLELSWAIWQ
jgi:hypothetical protein